MKANSATSARHRMMPNSSAATANTKSVWLSGRLRLAIPSPGPEPEPAAVPEGFHRHVDLEGVAGGRVHEALDAARDVRHQQDRRRTIRRPATPARPTTQIIRMPAMKNSGPIPSGSAWSGRSRVPSPTARPASTTARSPSSSGHFRTFCGLRKQPRCHHDESRLGGF